MKQFAYLTAEEQKEYSEVLQAALRYYYPSEEIGSGLNRYEIEIQHIKFETKLYDDEVEKASVLTVEVLEELKRINNEGYTGKMLQAAIDMAEMGNYGTPALLQIAVYKTFATDELTDLVSQLNKTMRVGGAYAMFIADPELIDVLVAVFQRIIDNFDNEDLFNQCAFFLFRGILRMHSVDIK